MLKEISDQEFTTEVEQAKGTVFVDFWAPWCGPCKMMAPIFEKMSQKYININFFKINTDDNPEKAGKYGVSGIPCIIVFKDGAEIDRIVGYKSSPAFEEDIKRFV